MGAGRGVESPVNRYSSKWVVWVADEVDSNDQHDDERWQISLIYKQIQSLAQHSSHSQDMADTSGAGQQTTGHLSHIYI